MEEKLKRLAMASILDEETVVLELTDPSRIEEQLAHDEISITTSDIESWNLDLILCSKIVKVHTNRSRIIRESTYFRGLLDGSFSESSLHHVAVQWNIEAVLGVIQYIYNSSLTVTPTNFLLLLEAALFFGVDNLFSKCETWFRHITSLRGLQEMSLDSILDIWKFGSEHGTIVVRAICEDYLSQNFAWATSCTSYADIPYDLLLSCVEHPQLTVECEKQLCEALLLWLANYTSLEGSSISSGKNYLDILNKVRICLLPLGYVAGLRRHFSEFADEAVCIIVDLVNDCFSRLVQTVTDDDTENSMIRLTEFSKKIDLSGCAHLTAPFLFWSVLPHDMDGMLKAKIVHSLINLHSNNGGSFQPLEMSLNMLSFEHVHEVDVSKCSKLHYGAAITWLQLAFPSLRILKASHCLHFTMEDLLFLIKKCPLINEVDLTVDVSPVTPTTSVLSAIAEGYQHSDGKQYKKLKEMTSLSNFVKHSFGRINLANISKLILEGRTDINDSDLLYISTLFDSLSYLNIRGCTLVTDMGISKLICKCRNIHTLILSYTSFGKISILTLCSSHTFLDDFPGLHHKYSDMMAFRLQQLHIDGCKGVDQDSMSQLMSHTYMLKILNLRNTCLVDDTLFEFMGCSLESLDVSETMVSTKALTYVVKRNPHIRCLRATSSRNLHNGIYDDLTNANTSSSDDLFAELSKKCMLEEVSFGWGFSSFQLESLKPAISNLRSITVGLGASLDHQTLCMLPTFCPLLESVILIFQIISDTIVRNFLESLKHLEVLWLRSCLGDLTSVSFQINMENLKTLRLEWVTPWMTNADLVVLTQNCPNLVVLSLSGCKLLDSCSQEIIASAWPGLTQIHLENCGKVTSDGVSFLFNCRAVEDLLLRHNGRGIRRNFMSDAASKLPLLRKLALDLCDACEGGFDSLTHGERFFYMRNVRISRCTSHKCGIEVHAVDEYKPVHKETIVLEWTSTELRTTVVKERA